MRSAWLGTLALTAACGPRFPEADLTDLEAVVHLEYHSRVDTLRAWLGSFPDPDACQVQDDAFDGDCEVGNETWTGRATRSDNGTITYRGLTYRLRNADCADSHITLENQRGRVRSRSEGQQFEAQITGTVVLRDCDAPEETRYDFEVDYEAIQEDGGLWTGSGTYGDDLFGRVELETSLFGGPDLLKCVEEPEFGTTTLRTADHEVVISFDGDATCDGLAQMRLDGDPSTVAIRGCTTTGALRSPGWAGWLVAALLLGRRRFPRRPTLDRPTLDR